MLKKQPFKQFSEKAQQKIPEDLIKIHHHEHQGYRMFRRFGKLRHDSC